MLIFANRGLGLPVSIEKVPNRGVGLILLNPEVPNRALGLILLNSGMPNRGLGLILSNSEMQNRALGLVLLNSEAPNRALGLYASEPRRGSRAKVRLFIGISCRCPRIFFNYLQTSPRWWVRRRKRGRSRPRRGYYYLHLTYNHHTYLHYIQ